MARCNGRGRGALVGLIHLDRPCDAEAMGNVTVSGGALHAIIELFHLLIFTHAMAGMVMR